MNKIRQYFTTFVLIRGLMIATLGSAFIYLNHWGFSFPLINTFLGILSLYVLLQSDTKIWFTSGIFMGLFWFWWIALSLIHYEMLWAVPLELLIIMLSYGFIFALISWLSEKITGFFSTPYLLLTLTVKAFGLILLSYVHPFSFDWYKPELMFVESYVGILKWQFALVLISIILSIWRQQFLYLLLILFASQTFIQQNTKENAINTTKDISSTLTLITTHTSVQDKWDENKHQKQFDVLLSAIDHAIKDKKRLVIFPESVFPIFLNRSEELFNTLKEKAKHISIVVGALYWDGRTPRNSTYIFTKDHVSIANKVLLVPFGEANPLPDFLSDWVNKVFYDGAVDYKADSEVTDYEIDGTRYRNAICFEATSEKLYVTNKNGNYPPYMIVLSNNGWFTPSIEPSLQKLLLQYYSKKYGTTIYHAVNMSNSYIIQKGKVVTK